MNQKNLQKNKINAEVTKEKEVIPIFFATDDNYIPFLAVSIKSLLDNASKQYNYKIYVLNKGLNDESKTKLRKLETENSKIYFVNLSKYIEKIRERLYGTLRDYYTESIFYRLFIATLYPEYKKAIYLDCDIVVVDDISKMYNTKLENNIVGACTDDVINSRAEFRDYATYAVGVPYNDYFNSGVLLINLDEYRKENIKERFIYLLYKYNFETLCPDQDYLNVLCKGKVCKMDKNWNRMPIDPNVEGKIHIIHYNNFRKPWLYDDVMFGDIFWEYAKKTDYYEDILKIKNSFTPEMDKQKTKGAEKLSSEAVRLASSDKSFRKVLQKD